MIDALRMVRKLRKGSHGYLTFQIPQEIKEQLNLKSGDKVTVTLTENGVIMLEQKDKASKRVVGTSGENVQVTNLNTESDRLVTG
jgi:AbrB family looped-hinge helix DNA binding protein